MVTVLTPTRQRADLWFKNIRQCFEKSKTDPEFLTYVDNDDPELEKYKNYVKELTDLDLKMIIGKPMRSAPAMRHLAFLAKHDYMIFGTDDLDWRTEGWDEKLIAKMPEHQLSVIYPASIEGNKIKARIPFFSKRFRDITDLWPADAFVHFGPDGYIVKVAEAAKVEIFCYKVEILHSKIRDDTSSRARRNGTGNWKDIVNAMRREIEEKGNRIKAAIND